MSNADAPSRVVMGHVSAVVGIKGWVKVASYTRPIDALLDYRSWWLCRDGAAARPVRMAEGRLQAGGLVVRLEAADESQPIADRDAAAALVGHRIEIERSALPKLKKDEYYWADLIGLAVESKDGVALGRVTGLIDNGAQDVLVIEDGETERLIPFVQGPIIDAVDLKAGRIVADWQPDW